MLKPGRLCGRDPSEERTFAAVEHRNPLPLRRREFAGGHCDDVGGRPLPALSRDAMRDGSAVEPESSELIAGEQSALLACKPTPTFGRR